jgi:hypothetical protein|nr:hypothetical protein [uncultured Acetatifactor sp.]
MKYVKIPVKACGEARNTADKEGNLLLQPDGFRPIWNRRAGGKLPLSLTYSNG